MEIFFETFSNTYSELFFLGKILMQMILSGSLNTHDVLQYEAPLNTSW